MLMVEAWRTENGMHVLGGLSLSPWEPREVRQGREIAIMRCIMCPVLYR